MKISILKRLLVSLVILFTFGSAYAQKDSSFSISCDLNSRYVWRGTDFGASPSIQPSVEFVKKGFVFGAWGAYSTNLVGSQELDLYLSYTFKEIVTVTFTDYFFPNELAANDNYFNYGDTTTGHVFELSASYNGTDDFPLTFLIATNVYGADAKRLDTAANVLGNQFSTYAELNYAFDNVEVFAGFNLTKPNAKNGESGYYGSKMGFVNIGATFSKEIKITNDFSLPASISLITNPMTEKVFLVFGFSF
jgi:hypothetical protein